MHRMLPTVACVLLTSCAQDGRGSTAPPSSSSGSAASSILTEAVRNEVCKAEPCGGDRSEIRIYRDDAGAVKRLYRLYGSCSHSPGIYFDPDGKETEAIPEKPIVPGSDEAKALAAKHDAQTSGLEHTDTIRCSDGSRSAP